MKFYEKPMAIINKFEVEDIIAASSLKAETQDLQDVMGDEYVEGTQGVIFQW